MKRGLFITLEGIDGVGKSTQAALLKRWLEEKGRRVTLTREPGGSPLSEKIRAILLNPKTKIENLTELLLYQAARFEHVKKVIQPALAKGRTVICDRFTDATLAYQGYGRGLLNKTPIHLLNEIASDHLNPDLTIILDMNPRESFQKARKLKKQDRLENEGLEFQKRVRKGYLALAKSNRQRIKVIPVQESIIETQELIRNEISKLTN